MNLYGPPGSLLYILESSPKTIANNIAPIEANNHPRMLTNPYNAKLAGRRNIPDPIMFPTTSEALDQNPKVLFLSKFI